MVQQQPAGFEQRAETFEVFSESLAADMFEHTDRGDGVEPALDLPVVTLDDRHPILHPEFPRPLPGIGRLLAAQRHPGRLHSVLDGGVQDQATPAGSDVEHAITRLETEFAADDIELAVLCLVERFERVQEVGRRIHHRRTEEPSEEVVPGVVVMRHGGTVPL